ncbi:MAG: cation:proton antiporter [Gemmatimonadales bacterium]|nr:cation:proton antiporter [Gemmatimonadales bacterium]
MTRFSRRLIVLAALIVPTLAATGGNIAPVALALAVILLAAKLGGDAAVRTGQPAVLGELVVGVVLGNLGLLGLPWLEPIAQEPTIIMLAELGVLILLFEVGLEATVQDMVKVGLPSLLVALLGVVTPFVLGWGVGALVLPNESVYVHLFLGATLTATSVGITARVLRDLDKSRTPEARIILGAAVIDDVLGLVILAVVAGIIQAADQGRGVSLGATGLVMAKALVFLVGALVLGMWLSPRLFARAARLRGPGVLLATALSFCFLLAYLSSIMGLAPIVGAYAAGLILEDVHYREFAGRGERPLEALIQPVASILVPVFFVLMGMRVDLTAFAHTEVLGLAALLTVAAIIGKQACSLGAMGRGLDHLSIGIGMVPRGEVGLIFASIGMSLTIGGMPVVSPAIYSAIVIMVILTTMAAPPALKWSLNRRREGGSPTP